MGKTPGICNDGGKSLPTFKRTFHWDSLGIFLYRNMESGHLETTRMKPRHSCFLKTDCWTGVLLFLDAATSY